MKRLLILDDDQHMHDLYRDLFSRKKGEYELVMTYDVQEAIDRLNDTDFDLVIMDIIMQPLSGEYLFLKIREDEKVKNNQVPIIVVTVLNEENLEILKRTSNTFIFQKPFNSKDLLKKIEELLRS